MSKNLFLLILCFAVLEVQAVVMDPAAPEQKAEKPAATSKPAAPKPRPQSSRRASKPQAAKPLSSPPPSKASLGFYQASANENYDMMEIYLQQGADINCRSCNDYQMTALYRALGVNNVQNYRLADWLLQRGADINIPANSGQSLGTTLVMTAAGYGSWPNFQFLEYLVKHDANFKAVDSTGRTALHYIGRWDKIDSDLPYYHDERKIFIASVGLLIENGIDVNHQDKGGTTALMNAVNDCSPGATKLLISYGADAALKDKLGKTAIDIAMERATQSSQNSGCNEVVKILSNPAQATRSSADEISFSSGANHAKQTTQSTANFAGTYAGSYNGSDSGAFQVTIADDGSAKLNGRSSKFGLSFTGEGKVSPDGSVAVGSASTGSKFAGSINSSGVLSGAWQNTKYNQAGSFQGEKGALMPDVKPNPIEALGTGLKILNSILAPR